MPVIKIGMSKEISSFRKEFKEIMNELFSVPYGTITARGSWIPAIDIYADSSHVYLVADLAGVESDSLELVIEGQFLRMSGNRKPPLTIKEKRFFQMEVEYGPFERVVRIPLPIETRQIDARMENGLLLVRFNKKGTDRMKIEIR